MAKKSKAVQVDSDGSESKLVELVARFSVKRAVEWLRIKFPSFDTSRAEDVACDTTKNEKDYFVSAELLGYVTRLPLGKSDDANKPVLVAAIKMRKDLTERTSRLVQFNYAKKLLQNAIAKGAQGVSGLPSQGLFFFYDKDGFFRLSLVTGEVEKRKFKFSEAKRQSFYIEPQAANNIVKRRLVPPIKTFAELKDVFSVEQLTKEFYSKLFDWYTWAMSAKANVSFPNDLDDDKDDRKYNNEALIRMITRLMFTWFIRQRKLVPDVLFDREGLQDVLKNFEPDSMEKDNYYRAILQNLFFATFNCPQSGKGKLTRRWIDADVKASGNGVGLSPDYRVTTVYRYRNEFRRPDEFLEMMRKVPFLNCALFDCLDKVERKVDGGRKLYFDGFSTKKARQAHVPNGLFFDPERGIINLFNLYEFTVNENNADDSDVALDPELLGKVFENLLGAFNPETQETARNATGSFYTPREIVDYMVEESLRNYLKTKVPEADDARLNDLFDRNKAAEGADTMFSAKEREAILSALYGCKILDPACGSGAFPMGVLHCMVRLLTRLDPQCISIREHLLSRYRADKASVDPTETEDERKERLAELESRLKEGQHYPDYERKLYLIENCIYGVDIQPIATQISKLRFFISLLCDQLRSSYDPDAENFGLLSLPNLEAKFVCANTLISLPNLEDEFSYDEKVVELRVALQENRHKIFRARSTKTKDKYKRRDLEIRDAIRQTVKDSLSKPDELVIAKCREQIDDAKERRQKVAEPDWYEENVKVQADLFSAFESKRVRKDRNEPERGKIDAEIQWAEKKIRDELAKSDKANVSAAARYADMVAGWDPYDQNASSSFFDPEWMFNIKDGFDVVIGNPPYVAMRSGIIKDSVKAYFQSAYVSAKGQFDLYGLFIEQGYSLLHVNGQLAYITESTFLNNRDFVALRKLLLRKTNIKKLIYLGEDVFDTANVDVLVTILEKTYSGENIISVCESTADFQVDRFHYVAQKAFDNDVTKYEIKIRGGMEDLQLFEKLKEGRETIGTIAELPRGMEFGSNSNMIISCPKAGFQKLLVGRDVKRYEISFAGRYVKYIHGQDSVFKDIRYYTSPKLFIQRIRNLSLHDRIVATYDDAGYFCTNTLRMLILKETFKRKYPLKCVLGIINSKLINHIFLTLFLNKDIYSYQLEQIPVPIISEVDRHRLESLVDAVLKCKSSNKDSSALESEIDQLVYKLYGLTDEEIAVVEGRGESNLKSEESKTVRASANRRNATVPETSTDDEELE